VVPAAEVLSRVRAEIAALQEEIARRVVPVLFAG
jgi:hypothetical protein